MKYIRQILVVIATLGSLLSLEMGIAQTTQSTEATNAETAYTEGEEKRVDLSLGKITIKHGFIKNLDMPPMTMVFTVKEKSLLHDIEVGQQVRFKVISEGPKIVITDLVK
jgi:Cu(I)/Ag(I) efflux system protein CusF